MSSHSKDGFLTQKEWTAKTLVRAADVKDMVLQVLWQDEQGLLESLSGAKKPSRLHILLKKVADLEKQLELHKQTIRESRKEMIEQCLSKEAQTLKALCEMFHKAHSTFICADHARADSVQVECAPDEKFSLPEMGMLGCKFVVKNESGDKDLLGSLGQPLVDSVVGPLCARMGMEAGALGLMEVGDGDEVYLGLTVEVGALNKAAEKNEFHFGEDAKADKSLQWHADHILALIAASEQQRLRVQEKKVFAERLQQLQDGRDEILRRREV